MKTFLDTLRISGKAGIIPGSGSAPTNLLVNTARASNRRWDAILMTNAKHLVTAFCVGIALLTGQAATAQSLVIGTISNEPVKEIRTFLPFAKYLIKQLESTGISEGKVLIARDMDHMADLLRTGQIDLYIDSPLVVLAVNKKTGSRLSVRRWKNKVKEYSSVIFARSDSGIGAVRDLAGKVIAFEESFSSSGHFLPRITMADLGVEFARLSSHREEPAANQTGFIFSGDDENTIEWVLRGRTDAGAMSNSNFEKLAETRRDELAIILRSEAIPRQVVAIGAHISQPLAAKINSALVDMNQSEEGRKILYDFERTTKFDAIPAETLTLLEQFQGPLTAIIDGE